MDGLEEIKSKLIFIIYKAFKNGRSRKESTIYFYHVLILGSYYNLGMFSSVLLSNYFSEVKNNLSIILSVVIIFPSIIYIYLYQKKGRQKYSYQYFCELEEKYDRKISVICARILWFFLFLLIVGFLPLVYFIDRLCSS